MRAVEVKVKRMDNRLIFYNQPPKTKYKLIEQINSIMNIPNTGVYIVFDNDEFPNYINKRFRRAFYMNIKKGGIEELSPIHILEIMNKADCEHFVWVSKSVGEDEDI